ncbi:MAG: outer membrane protein assembly factor BamD [Candidatus Nucleicultricaceae bacterium]
MSYSAAFLTKQCFLKVFAVSSLALMVLAGCSHEEDEKFADKSVEELYNMAMDLFEQDEFTKAAKTFEEVDRQHPYSKWAAKAEIMSAYSYYQAQKYQKALAQVETFLQLHPAHPDVAYAYYLQGLCYLEQISPLRRDQHMTETTLNTFEEIVKRFPTSPYTKEARIKIAYLKDALAAKEMAVGREYLNQGGYMAALNRFQTVVKKFETTNQVPEALYRIIEVYVAVGSKNLAEKTAAILGHNFPGNSWYAEAYYLLEGVDMRPQYEAERPVFAWPWETVPAEKPVDSKKSRFE